MHARPAPLQSRVIPAAALPPPPPPLPAHVRPSDPARPPLPCHAGVAARPAAPCHAQPRSAALRCQAAKGDGGGRSGRSGGSRGGGGSKRGGGKQQKAQRAAPPAGGGKQRQREQEAQQALVPPLRTQVVGELSSSDRAPEPLWSTFCGVTNGLWCGITQAHSPFTGGPGARPGSAWDSPGLRRQRSSRRGAGRRRLARVFGSLA